MPHKHIHLIGIGGISMSGIAEVLLNRNYKVSGSDLNDSHLLDKLRRKGAEIFIGHSAENVRGAELVVISNAIPEDNVELQYAINNEIPIIKRAQMLARLMQANNCIAVSGTHGKTTTTSMISTVLKGGNLDPTILVGGELDAIDGNVYIGDGDYFVTEADESDGSLLYFDPFIAIVTNIELDHMDYYDSHKKLLNTFRKFIDKVPENGKVILCEDDKTSSFLFDDDDYRFLTYGFNRGNIRAVKIKLLPFGSYYTVVYNGNELGEINLQIPGKHNILNSLAAIATGMFIGMSFTEIKNSLESFAGVGRRFEKKGLIGDILVVDDYAHHPTEIKATLKAACNTGYDRIIAVFQPHRYSRTKHLLEEFSRSFDNVDHLIVTDIYSAGENKIPGVKAENLIPLITKNSKTKVDFVKEFNDIVNYLRKIIKPRDLVLTIGAGDVYKVGEVLLKEMKEKREMA